MTATAQKARPTTIPDRISALTDAIVRVGEGRGFLVAQHMRPDGTRFPGDHYEAYVVTAAHCLPHLPPPHAMSYTEERTYANLIGPIGSKPSIWTECVFVNPVNDIAVLAAPDDQQISDEWLAYEHFVAGRPTITLGRAQHTETRAWLYGKKNVWEPCLVSSHLSRWLKVRNAPTHAFAPGTSGSPILNGDGHAVGLIAIGEMPNPELASDLPGWLIRRWFDTKGGA